MPFPVTILDVAFSDSSKGLPGPVCHDAGEEEPPDTVNAVVDDGGTREADAGRPRAGLESLTTTLLLLLLAATATATAGDPEERPRTASGGGPAPAVDADAVDPAPICNKDCVRAMVLLLGNGGSVPLE